MQAVDRAVDVLEFLAARRRAGGTEIAAALGVHKSTAFRLVNALVARGLVEQRTPRGKYCLGFELIRLGGAKRFQPDMITLANPVCERLAEEVGETVNIAVSEDGMAVNIAQARGLAAVITQNWLGRRTPLHATASGKVLLAFTPARERSDLFAAGLEEYTSSTVTDLAALEEELARITAQGYGLASEELELGLNAAAAPVRAADGTVVFAVSASGPSYRLTAERLPDVAKSVIDTATELSWLLGYLPE
ncbi:IclR family transcriptional regulator [Streptomyces sp. N2-109]|uniref:IclR family transcriptional regulator n=1 Tax=Streptomyces gossypii TaxID=2883101 RepID=A0ABT2JU48_9ACTN|nr:IclR family transcriptional regulator [Streptomyces gossypii]